MTPGGSRAAEEETDGDADCEEKAKRGGILGAMKALRDCISEDGMGGGRR